MNNRFFPSEKGTTEPVPAGCGLFYSFPTSIHVFKSFLSFSVSHAGNQKLCTWLVWLLFPHWGLCLFPILLFQGGKIRSPGCIFFPLEEGETSCSPPSFPLLNLISMKGKAPFPLYLNKLVGDEAPPPFPFLLPQEKAFI